RRATSSAFGAAGRGAAARPGAPPVRMPGAGGSRLGARALQRAAAPPRELRAGARMRLLADTERLQRFLVELARAADGPADVYLTGGSTAVLLGWRHTTIDADILIVPERDALLRVLPRLKEELQLNVEIAGPPHFIPELPGWRERRIFIVREGHVSFYHYDLYSQALAKIERGHAKDLADVDEMISRGLVE